MILTLLPKANSPNSQRQRLDEPELRATIIGVLRGVAPWVDDVEWLIDQLAIGGQARIFAAGKRDGSTICGGDGAGAERELIVKLFDPAMPDLTRAVNDAFDSLSYLSRQLDGARIGGWHVRCPVPLHKSHEPHALVMTPVPGRSLNHLLDETDDFGGDSLVPVVAEALHRFWANGGGGGGGTRMYGDMNLYNVLCEPDARTVSFVDCGMPDRFWLCEGVSRRYFPVSRDLGYLLYSSASAVRASLGKPRHRRRELRVVRQLVGACVTLVAGSNDERRRRELLDEIAACARWHVSGIGASASPAGLWRSFVKRTTVRCVTRTIAALRDLQQGVPA